MTKPNCDNEGRDRPVVTEEMIDAGSEMWMHYDPDWDDVERFLVKVYTAMEEARRGSK